MVHGGACLCRAPEGDVVMVDGAIPGERVVAEVTGRRGGVSWARTAAVLEASGDRVEPPCPYVGECGGCDLQHVAAGRQLALKREVVTDQLRRHGVTPPDAVQVHAMADPWRYRRRGEFHVVRDRASPARPVVGLGFNRLRSWSAVAVHDCLIHHPAITGAIPALTAAAREADARLDLLHLTVGEDGAELLVAPKPPRAMPAAALDRAALGEGAGPARWATEATTLRWAGHAYRVSPQSFVQVNAEQMAVLYGRVLAALGDVAGRRIVDGYAGIGVLAVELATRVGPEGGVVCVEANRAAVRLGVLNARLNGVEGRLTYDPRPMEAALPALAGTADALVVDPPRAGCASTVTGFLALAGPPLVVYVACDPATLARDLRVLVGSGPYRLESLELVDMFPQTHHVETVATLRRERG